MSEAEHDDAAIEALLLERFEGPVPDDGFCDATMRRLPPRPRRRRLVWPLPVGLATGAAACWLNLQATPLLRTGWQDWLAGDLSTPALTLFAVMAGVSLLTLAWTVAEADDGGGGARL